MDSSRRGSKQIRRTRTINSCLQCRRRKIKCDKKQPVCSNCLRANGPCEYAPEARRGSPSGASHPSSVSRPGSAHPSPLKRRKSIGQTRADRDESSEKSPIRQSRPTSATPSANSPRGQRAATGSAGSPVSPSIEPPVGEDDSHGHLFTQNGEFCRYVGASHWAFIVDSPEELDQLLEDIYRLETARQPTPPADGEQKSSEDKQMKLVAFQQQIMLGGLKNSVAVVKSADLTSESFGEFRASALPPRSLCNMLYRCFVARVYSIFPIVYLPHLLDWYNEFWNRHKSRKRSQDQTSTAEFWPLLWTILHGGAACATDRAIGAAFPRQDRSELVTSFREKAITSLAVQNVLEKPHLPGLVALIFSQLISMSDSGTFAGRISLSLIVQLCTSLGIHREPAKFGIPFLESETRRRFWHHIVWMDGVLSLASGMPPLVSSGTYWDVRPIPELRDGLVGTSEGRTYLSALDGGADKDACSDPVTETVGSRVSPVAILGQARIIIAQFLHDSGRSLLGALPITAESFRLCVRSLSLLEQELQDRFERIPDPLIFSREMMGTLHTGAPTESEGLWEWYRSIPRDDICSEDIVELREAWIAFHSVVRIYLEMILHQCACLVYKSVLQRGHSRVWNAVRLRALPHAHAYLEQWLSVAGSTLCRSYMLTSPPSSLNPPYDVMMMLLTDLLKMPTATEAARSRMLIDRMFLITNAEGQLPALRGVQASNVIESGAAWRLLRSLREQAWRAANQDPSVLYLPTGSGADNAENIRTVPWPYVREGREDASSSEDEDDNEASDNDDLSNIPRGRAQGSFGNPPSTPVGHSWEVAIPTHSESRTLLGPAARSLEIPTEPLPGAPVGELTWAEWDELFGHLQNLEGENDVEMGE